MFHLAPYNTLHQGWPIIQALGGHIVKNHVLKKQNISALLDSFLILFIQLQQVSFN